MPMRLLKIGLLLVSCALGACSTGTKLAYNNLDTLLNLEVGTYVDLEKPQSAMLRREFKSVWDWHRSQELPRYAKTLRGTADDLDRGNLDTAAVEQLLQVVEDSTERLQRQANPAFARVLVALSDAQVAELLGNLSRELDKNEAKYADETVAERRERVTSKSLSRLDDWLGSVLPAQRALTADRVAAAEAKGWLEPRRKRAQAEQQSQRFATVLLSRSQSGFAARLLALDEPTDPAAQAELAAERERVRSYFVALAPTLDARQRAHLAKRLRDFAADFETLAAKPLTSPPGSN